MAKNTESAKIQTSTLKEFRKWSKESGRNITFLIECALRQALMDKVGMEQRMSGPKS